MKLKQGNLVRVYQDPISKKKLEGDADLRKAVGDDIDGLERWIVHFIGDHPSESYDRIVDPADKIK